MLKQTSEASPPKQKRKTFLSTRPQTDIFVGTPQHHVGLNPADLYLCGHLKTLVYSASSENEETFHQRIFDSSQGAMLHDQTCPCAH